MLAEASTENYSLPADLMPDRHRDYAAERAIWQTDLARYRKAAEAAADESTRRRYLGEVARALGHLGYVAHKQGGYAAAAALHQERLTLQQQLLDSLGIGLALLALGDALRAQHNERLARARYEECLEVARCLGDAWLFTFVSQKLGRGAIPLTKLSPWYGRLVDVGGHRLYLYSDGVGALGSPTVVLEAAADTPWSSWTQGVGHHSTNPRRPAQPGITASVGAFARVLSYSRAGVTDSEPGPLPRTSGRIADDLYALLAENGTLPPYVLVAHGFGCLSAHLYAAGHSDEVAGLVLLDAPTDPQLEQATCERAVRDGGFTSGLQANAPATDWWLRSREHVDYATSAAQFRACPAIPALPVVWVAPRWQCRSYRQPDSRAGVSERDLNEALTSAVQRYGPSVQFVVAQKSGYHIPIDEPEVVIDAIRAVVQAARRSA